MGGDHLGTEITQGLRTEHGGPQHLGQKGEKPAVQTGGASEEGGSRKPSKECLKEEGGTNCVEFC